MVGGTAEEKKGRNSNFFCIKHITEDFAWKGRYFKTIVIGIIYNRVLITVNWGFLISS